MSLITNLELKPSQNNLEQAIENYIYYVKKCPQRELMREFKLSETNLSNILKRLQETDRIILTKSGRLRMCVAIL